MAKPKQTALHEEKYDKQCIWKTDGYQCQAEGHMSSNTLGGPWYCRSHFAKLMKWEPWQAPVQEADVDRRVNSLVPKKPGESDHDWSMRCKDWVLERIGKRQRQPGEDDEIIDRLVSRYGDMAL